MPTMRGTVLGLALSVIASASCASAPAARGSQARDDCIRVREINAMTPLDDQHVFVKLGANHHYLFTMDQQCPGLSLARRLTIWEATTRVCGGGVSLLAFEQPSVGAMRCRIELIDSVRDKNAARDLIKARTPPK